MVYNLPKLPNRIQNSNKATFGKVLDVSGSKYMTGAAYLSSVSALKIGCGYAFLVSCEEVIRAVAAQTQNIVFVPLNEIDKHIKNCDVLSIGCGLSTSDEAINLFKYVISNVPDIPVIIDADGINILSKINEIKLPEKLILTPHPKEASRLLNEDTEYILNNMEESAKRICEKYNCVTVLKSHKTIVRNPQGEMYYNTTGNSAMAKAGSGDVLTGMISGLSAQKMTLFDAAVLGVYLHGLAGDLAKEDLTEYGVMASDLIRYIPYAIKKIIV